MIKIILGLSLLISYSAYSRELKIATFNIRLYGLGGEWSGTFRDEYRDRSLKEFIKFSLKNTDVILFQEIINFDRLKKLMSKKYSCVSYEHKIVTHQKVALCFFHKYEFKISSDNNFTWEDVALNWYRPAVHGILSEEGDDIAHIVGVHLKARIDSPDMREKQVKMISEHLDRRPSIPYIILGDFNSFEGEVDIFKNILNPYNLKNIENKLGTTYRTFRYSNTLDHIWISNSVKQLSELDVFPVCLESVRGQERYLDLAFYLRQISDHCPVSVTLGF